MKSLHMATFILLVAGGLNWLLVGIFNFDLVGYIGGMTHPTVATTVYVLVGLSAVYEIVTHKKNCRLCDNGTGGSAAM